MILTYEQEKKLNELLLSGVAPIDAVREAEKIKSTKSSKFVPEVENISGVDLDDGVTGSGNHFSRTYGIHGLKERDAILKFQGGCGLCGKKKLHSFRGKRTEKWIVDHDHFVKTGRKSVRGILCGSCNLKAPLLEVYQERVKSEYLPILAEEIFRKNYIERDGMEVVFVGMKEMHNLKYVIVRYKDSIVNYTINWKHYDRILDELKRGREYLLNPPFKAYEKFRQKEMEK